MDCCAALTHSAWCESALMSLVKSRHLEIMLLKTQSKHLWYWHCCCLSLFKMLQMYSLFIYIYILRAPCETAAQRCRVEISPLFSHVLRPPVLIGLNITTVQGGCEFIFFTITLRNAHSDDRESHFKLGNTLHAHRLYRRRSRMERGRWVKPQTETQGFFKKSPLKYKDRLRQLLTLHDWVQHFSVSFKSKLTH